MDKKKCRNLAKWIIGIVSCCVLIYLGIRYIHVIGNSIWWLLQLVMPILIGIILALILNIPLQFFERRIFSKRLSIQSQKIKRNLSICLSLLCIFGVIVLVLFLVVPELVQAIITLVNIGTDSIHILSEITETLDYSSLPFGEYLEKINIDWGALAARLQDLLPTFINDLAIRIPKVIGSSLGTFVDIILGLIFAVYILAQKEKLKGQVIHLIHVWIPEKIGNAAIHIAAVCTQSFRNFMVGQTTEAIILGTLCSLGMAILRLPYAPTIGVLVGVTAYVPYIGAYIGAIVGFIMILTINPFKAVIFVIFLVILQQVEGNIIYPKVVGNRINLPSIWVLAGLTVGGNFAGPVGMILGVPACSAAYNLLQEATQKREEHTQINLKGNDYE